MEVLFYNIKNILWESSRVIIYFFNIYSNIQLIIAYLTKKHREEVGKLANKFLKNNVHLSIFIFLFIYYLFKKLLLKTFSNLVKNYY